MNGPYRVIEPKEFQDQVLDRLTDQDAWELIKEQLDYLVATHPEQAVHQCGGHTVRVAVDETARTISYKEIE